MLDVIYVISELATAVAVGVAAYQLYQNRSLAITSFEDEVSNEYRAIIKEIPIDVMLGGEPCPEDAKRCRNQIYNYIDFTNE